MTLAGWAAGNAWRPRLVGAVVAEHSIVIWSDYI
jgi:hypothetical protein